MIRLMKDSRIEWVSKIADHWVMSRVGLHNNIILGKMLCDKQLAEDYTLEPYFCAANVHFDGVSQENLKQMWFSSAEKAAYCVQNGDLLVVEGGAGAGGAAIVENLEQPTYVQNSVMIVRGLGGQTNRYLRYWIECLVKKGYIDVVCNKATIPHFTKDKLATMPVPVIPVEEMEAIADFLDRQCAEIDAVIERTKATIEEYKKLKQAVITEAVTKGVRGARKMKDSGIEWIGEIPEEWSIRKLKSFSCIISKGATPKDISKEVGASHPIRFLKSENIVDNQLTQNPEFYISDDVHTGELKRSELSCDDILFVIAGASIGKVALMDAALLPANTNQAVSFIRVSNEYRAAKRFIWYVLQSRIMKTYIALFAVQSAQPNMSMEDLGDFRMPFAYNKEEVVEIVSLLDNQCAALDTLITKKTALLTELETYKKSLIYEYVTGKKEVN